MIYRHNTFISPSDTCKYSQLCIGLYSCNRSCSYFPSKPFSHQTSLLFQMETVRETEINMEFSVVPQKLLGLHHGMNWCLISVGVWGTHQIPCTSRKHIHPLKKEVNFPWRLSTPFSASFQKAYTFEKDLKSSAVSKRPENLYGKNKHTGCTTCLYLNHSSETEKKKIQICTPVLKHLPKCKAVVNQVIAICMLISILLCYQKVQEESWKAFNVPFSIPSQHVIIVKPPPLFFNRLRRMQMVFLIVHEMSLNFSFTLRVHSFNQLFGLFQTGCIVSFIFFL